MCTRGKQYSYIAFNATVISRFLESRFQSPRGVTNAGFPAETIGDMLRDDPELSNADGVTSLLSLS